MKNLLISRETISIILKLLFKILLSIKTAFIIILYLYIVLINSSSVLVVYDYVLILIIFAIYILLLSIKDYESRVENVRFSGVILFLVNPILSFLIRYNKKKNTVTRVERKIVSWKKSVLSMQYVALIMFLPFTVVHYMISKYYVDILFLDQTFMPNSFIQIMLMSGILGVTLIWPFITLGLILLSVIRTHKECFNDVIVLNVLVALTSFWVSFHVPILLANVYSIIKSTKKLE